MKLLTPTPRQHFQLDPSGNSYASGDDRVIIVEHGADAAQLMNLGCVEVVETLAVNVQVSSSPTESQPAAPEPHE